MCITIGVDLGRGKNERRASDGAARDRQTHQRRRQHSGQRVQGHLRGADEVARTGNGRQLQEGAYCGVGSRRRFLSPPGKPCAVGWTSCEETAALFRVPRAARVCTHTLLIRATCAGSIGKVRLDSGTSLVATIRNLLQFLGKSHFFTQKPKYVPLKKTNFYGKNYFYWKK